MRKMMTNELTGPALNWAVSMAIGEYSPVAVPAYSTDWTHGGPIIERAKIAVYRDDMDVYWWGKTNTTKPINGETPLAAAMRCYVVSKLGNEIDIPETLK